MPRGEIKRTNDGRAMQRLLHPRTRQVPYVFNYILVAEKALGKYLPLDAVVHHVDGNPTNDHPTNLVVCEDKSYHRLLHCRQRAHRESGNANWRLCYICHTYDAPENLKLNPASRASYHRTCDAQRANAYRIHRDGT